MIFSIISIAQHPEVLVLSNKAHTKQGYTKAKLTVEDLQNEITPNVRKCPVRRP
jgi:hypothetical protein